VDSLFKQRLVGILVILSVAAIFWPLIFAPYEYREGTDFVEIPPAPNFKKNSESTLEMRTLDLKEEAEYPNNWLKTEADEVLEIPATNETDKIFATKSSSRQVRNTSPEKPQLDSKGIPIAFVLQVASMVDNDRAKKVRDKLLEQGYRAYLRQVKVGETIMYRVYVGPKFEKLELASIKSEIDKIFKVDSVILRYVP